jgi:hypothetical protein
METGFGGAPYDKAGRQMTETYRHYLKLPEEGEPSLKRRLDNAALMWSTR